MLRVFNMSKKKRRKFTREYKAEVVRMVRDGGRSVIRLCDELKLPVSSVYEWVRQGEIDSGHNPTGALTTAERHELSQLRRENRELRKEREFLGKAAAFFASQKK